MVDAEGGEKLKDILPTQEKFSEALEIQVVMRPPVHNSMNTVGHAGPDA